MTVQHIKLNDIEKAISTKIESKISAIKKSKGLKEKTQNVEGRFEYNSNLDIYIDTENGKLVNDNGKISYTFPMFRKSEEKLENIVFVQTNSNDIETYIAKYNIKPEIFKELTISEQSAYEPELQKIYFNTWWIVCIESVEESQGVPINQGEVYGVHDYETVWNVTGSICYMMESGGGDNGGGGGYPGGYNNSGNTGGNVGGGAHGGGSGTGSNGVSTSPTISTTKPIVKEFIKQLSEQDDDNLENCFNGLTDDKKKKILDFVGNLALEELEDECPNNPSTNEQVFDLLNDLIQSQCEGGDNATNNWNDFENWFLGSSEGLDGSYDSEYWENPNLTFPQQNLPSFSAFDNAYPRDLNGNLMTGSELYPLVGGDVYQAYTDYPTLVRGACALKVSRALNYSGVVIPNLVGKTLKGADDKYYFVNAKSLNAWMRKTFGTNPSTPNNPLCNNHIRIDKCQGGKNGTNFPALIANKKGIYTMVARSEIITQWGSGHADILTNGNCGTNCHFYDKINKFVPVDYIDIWILE